jgi:hypothetical protein
MLKIKMAGYLIGFSESKYTLGKFDSVQQVVGHLQNKEVYFYDRHYNYEIDEEYNLHLKNVTEEKEYLKEVRDRINDMCREIGERKSDIRHLTEEIKENINSFISSESSLDVETLEYKQGIIVKHKAEIKELEDKIQTHIQYNHKVTRKITFKPNKYCEHKNTIYIWIPFVMDKQEKIEERIKEEIL